MVTTRTTQRGRVGEWRAVCRLDELEVDRGAAALVRGQAIALFRTAEQLYALGNHDPFVKTPTGVGGAGGGIARGIVGVRDDIPFVALPAHRHAFDLRTGQCLDDGQVKIPAYAVRVIDGVVYVGARKAE